MLKGESLNSISKKYNVTVSHLEQLNPSAKKGLDVNAILQISEKKDVEVLEHEVFAKETLFGLSKKYNLSIEKLKLLNPSIESEELKAGQVLKILKSNNYSIPEKNVVEKPNQKKDKIEKVDALQEGFHIVLPKETKYGLSKKHKISISELEQLNPQIKNNLAVGTRLLIPKTEKTEKLVVLENVDLLNKTKTFSKEELSKIESVIIAATTNIGTKYKSGGTDTEGFDCSGLLFSSFKRIAIELPRTSAEQATIGVKTDKKGAQKGDLIFFATTSSAKISHVGLITKVTETDIQFVHASISSGVIISTLSESYYNKRFIQINRIISQL